MKSHLPTPQIKKFKKTNLFEKFTFVKTSQLTGLNFPAV